MRKIELLWCLIRVGSRAVRRRLRNHIHVASGPPARDDRVALHERQGPWPAFLPVRLLVRSLRSVLRESLRAFIVTGASMAYWRVPTALHRMSTTPVRHRRASSTPPARRAASATRDNVSLPDGVAARYVTSTPSEATPSQERRVDGVAFNGRGPARWACSLAVVSKGPLVRS